jgi:cell division protein FtsA
LKHIYTSVDLGSDSIKVVVCELYQSALNLLAATSYPSRGIKNGLIIDPALVEESIRLALNEVESMLGVKIKSVMVSVPSYQAAFTAIQGKIDVGGVVTTEHINAVLNEAYREKPLDDKEMVTLVPIDFSTDTEERIKDPKGRDTESLLVRAVMVSVPKKNIYSVLGLLEKMGLEVVDVMTESIGDMNTFKNKENSDKVGAIINIGSDTTSVSLYNKSVVIKNSIIGMGGRNIDNDIAYIYKLLPKDAVKIKETFALASSKYASGVEYIEVNDKFGDVRKISQKEVSGLVQSILEEILVLARKEINLLTKQTVNYIIITGGISSMANFSVVMEDMLGPIASIGTIKIPGIRNNKYSVALGNIVYFINKLKLKGIDYTMINGDEMETLSSNQKGFVSISSESMLGKVFGYFFNE